MTPASSVIFCLAYIVGLLSTAIPWGGVGVLALGIGVAILSEKRLGVAAWTQPIVPLQFRQMGLSSKLWLIAGLVGLLASLYLQIRMPQPGVRDISRWVPPTTTLTQQQVVTVLGRVESVPRLTRSQRVRFWLKATQLTSQQTEQLLGLGRSVIGKLYVTVPLEQAAQLSPGQSVKVTGSLYKPRPATNPQAFDFQAYLSREGAFAGLRGRQLTVLSKEPWGWWAIRQRIIQAQSRWLVQVLDSFCE